MMDKTILMFHARVREMFNRAYPTEPTDVKGLARYLHMKFTWGLENSQITMWDRRLGTYANCLCLTQEKHSMLVNAEERRKGGIQARGPAVQSSQ
jgi:hypothetical protein